MQGILKTHVHLGKVGFFIILFNLFWLQNTYMKCHLEKISS